jgi:hypothetical protein
MEGHAQQEQIFFVVEAFHLKSSSSSTASKAGYADIEQTYIYVLN